MSSCAFQLPLYYRLFTRAYQRDLVLAKQQLQASNRKPFLSDDESTSRIHVPLEKIIESNFLSPSKTSDANNVKAFPGSRYAAELYDFFTLSDFLALLPFGYHNMNQSAHIRDPKRLAMLQQNYNAISEAIKDYIKSIDTKLDKDINSNNRTYLQDERAHLVALQTKLFPTTGQLLWTWIKRLFFLALTIVAVAAALTCVGLLAQAAMGGTVISTLATLAILKIIISFLTTQALSFLPILSTVNSATLITTTLISTIVATFAMHRMWFEDTFNRFHLRTLYNHFAFSHHAKRNAWTLDNEPKFANINSTQAKFLFVMRTLINPARWLRTILVGLHTGFKHLNAKTFEFLPRPIPKFMHGLAEIASALIQIPVEILVKVGDIPANYLFPTLGKVMALVISTITLLPITAMIVGLSIRLIQLFGFRKEKGARASQVQKRINIHKINGDKLLNLAMILLLKPAQRNLPQRYTLLEQVLHKHAANLQPPPKRDNPNLRSIDYKLKLIQKFCKFMDKNPQQLHLQLLNFTIVALHVPDKFKDKKPLIQWAQKDLGLFIEQQTPIEKLDLFTLCQLIVEKLYHGENYPLKLQYNKYQQGYEIINTNEAECSNVTSNSNYSLKIEQLEDISNTVHGKIPEKNPQDPKLQHFKPAVDPARAYAITPWMQQPVNINKPSTQQPTSQQTQTLSGSTLVFTVND